VTKQIQPSECNKGSDWRLAGPAPDFVVGSVSGVWDTQYVLETPLKRMHKDANWRLLLYSMCLHYTSKLGVYTVHVVESDLVLQLDAAVPNIAIQSLHVTMGKFNPLDIRLTPSNRVNARYKVDKSQRLQHHGRIQIPQVEGISAYSDL